MINTLEIYRSEELSPGHNLAAEEYLTATCPPELARLFLWRNRGAVVIGKNQNCFSQCRAGRLVGDGYALARRLSGGGAVWHDEGNLCFSFICRAEDYDVGRQLSAVVSACLDFRIEALISGRNDITAGGAKFSGSAFWQTGDCRCHHGTVLISGELDALERYLTVSDEKLGSKGIRSVRSRVINLSELCPGLTVPDFSDALRRSTGALYGLSPLDMPMPPAGLFNERAGFFASDEWIYGENPDFTERRFRRFGWGELEINAEISGGKIVKCIVFSDALDASLAPLTAAALRGKEFLPQVCRDAVAGLPHGTDISEMF